MAAVTPLLGLVTPTQGTLSGTWGDTVNYGISEYVDIAIAGTLPFTGDSPVTLANTTGSSSGTGITTTTAQYACIRVTATTAATKVITGPSYSKTYLVDNASSFAITFKAAGQTGVSIAAGEKAIVFYNSAASNADYVKVSSIGSTGILSPVGGGTGVANNAAMTVTGSGNFAYTRTLTAATNVTFPTTGTLATLAGTETFTNKTLTTPIIASISNTGTLTLPTSTDTLVGKATTDTLSNKTLVAPALGTPSQGVLSSCTVDGTNKVGYQNIPLSGIKTASYTLVAGDVGKFVELGTSGTIVVPASVFATGDAISIFNNTSATISCTCSAITDFYKGGTDTDISTFSVTTRGVATILFITATRAVVTGNLA